jgi:hypothetical protein
MHGAHHVAQKSTRTTFSAIAFEVKRVPSTDSKWRAGAGCKVCAKAPRGKLFAHTKVHKRMNNRARIGLTRKIRVLRTVSGDFPQRSS